ncbi:MAG: amidase [Nitriliruptorales bacterium]|nr:amidase [Nitriliruptorales bacterium]
MTDVPWQGDACSLVDEFRAGGHSPAEELEATLAAIDASTLNAFSYVDRDAAVEAARVADRSLPFGGVPVAVKQLEPVRGWPYTEGSVVFSDRVADYNSTMVDRLVRSGGAVPVGQTTASEFGGLNVSVNRLNGVTRNPWDDERTAGGSSGGSAAAVAGGLLTLAAAGDGGGSIRIPAGYTGLFGLKGTYGRIPRGPHATIAPNTVVLGCLARSVRDVARYYDVCAGYDVSDPTSLESTGNWQARLGRHDLTGRSVIVAPDLGGVPLAPGVEARIVEAAEAVIADLGLRRVEADIQLPRLAGQWMMGNVATLLATLGDRWPACAAQMTDEIRMGVHLSQSLYNLRVAAAAEQERVRCNDALAAAFTAADFVISATNPDTAFDARDTMSSSLPRLPEWALSRSLTQRLLAPLMAVVRVGAGAFPGLPERLLDQAARAFADLLNMGALTMVSNIHGNPAASIPVGHVDGLPVGMQVLARHHQDALLLDLALQVERNRPWPLIAHGVTAGA